MDRAENNSEKILVVDDDPSIGQFLSKAIEMEGYQPLMCTHPEEALRVSEKESFGIAFVDINLPTMNGLDLATRLKEHEPSREVVFITGHGTLESAVRAIKIGAYDYLKKPFSMEDFNLCLKRYQERQALKEQVRLAEQRYFHLVQNIPLVIYVLRRGLILDFINETCRTMLGFTPDQALSTPNWFLELIHEKDRDRIKNLIQLAFESSGKSFSTDCRLIHRKGHLIHVILKSIPHFDDNPDTDHLEGIIVDITDRIFLEKAVVQKEKLKTLGSISAEVAHEIRNPLVSIGGYARRLQKKYPELAEGGIIVSESRRLEKILDRISNYLKPVEIMSRACFVNEIISYCVELLSSAIKKGQVRCELDLNQGLPALLADREILTQVFINLIRNALTNMEKGGTLIIKTFESDQNLHIDFKNRVTGKKIEDPEELFLPFDEGGQDIGLPLCYKLVRNMGGLISFEKQGDYMTFTVSLPKESPAVLPSQAVN